MLTLNVQNLGKRCKIADFEIVMRLINGPGATALAARAFYESDVYKLIVNCATGCFSYERCRREE